jgi:hypothetical protein
VKEKFLGATSDFSWDIGNDFWILVKKLIA